MLNTLMNKMMVVLMAGVMLGLGGCAVAPSKIMTGSIDNAYKLAKNNTGVIYGAWIDPESYAMGDSGITVKSACDYVKNSDPRCAHQEDYIVGDVVPSIYSYAGSAQILAFMPKSMNIKPHKLSWDTYTYVKVRSEPGKISEIIEIASEPGDKKCFWSGLPLGGGTVCPAYNWDYRNDLHSYDTNHLVMTVSDK